MNTGIKVILLNLWPSNEYISLYLQGESNDFETLLDCIKLLLVGSVVHYVRPKFNVLVIQIPAKQKGTTGVSGSWEFAAWEADNSVLGKLLRNVKPT